MDISQLLSVLRLNWDLPLRLVASLAAIATVVGLFTSSLPMTVVGKTLSWLGLNAASYAVFDAQRWLEVRSIPFAVLALIVFAVAVGFVGWYRTHGSGRSASTLLLSAALAIECGSQIPEMIYIGIVVLWLVTAVVRIVVLSRLSGYPSGTIAIEEWLRRSWTLPIAAAVYVPFAPLAWALG